MTFGTSVKTCLSKYAMFEGRACRSEYWYFYLFTVLLGFIPGFIAGFYHSSEKSPPIAVAATGLIFILSLATILPSLAVIVRRLHDTNRSGWWVFSSVGYMIGYLYLTLGHGFYREPRWIGIVLAIGCFACAIVYLFLMCSRGSDGQNDYGPDPLRLPDYRDNDLRLATRESSPGRALDTAVLHRPVGTPIKSGLADDLEKLGKLHAAGILDDAEFMQLKAKRIRDI